MEEYTLDYPTKEKKIKEILEQLYTEGKITPEKLNLSQLDLAHILENAKRNDYIGGVSITKTKSTPVIWYDDAYLTEEGKNYLYPEKKSTIEKNTFNFHNGDFRGSGFGSDITIENNWSYSLDELKNYVSTLSESDQEIGNELIEVVEKQDFKKGTLSRFSGFLEKHPNVVNYVGKVIVWALSNPDKLFQP